MNDPTLVIRGGTILDGTGKSAVEGDIAIIGDRIVQVGGRAPRAASEIDARGLLVTPGFVDIHTHYDGQATWSERMNPTTDHGVTTLVMGNCGVGFAPCRPQDRETLMRLMEGVEDLPNPVLKEGIPWGWESFPQYLDFLGQRRFDVDIGAQLPHAAVRVFVMGERAGRQELATAEDAAIMADVAAEAMRAGALGFSTSRNINHKGADGNVTPTVRAQTDELVAIANGMARAGSGVIQVSIFRDVETDFEMLREAVARSGRPMSLSLVIDPSAPNRWRDILARMHKAVDMGLPIRAQVSGRPIGILIGFQLPRHLFASNPTFKELSGSLSYQELVAALRRPEVRARILAEGHANGRHGDIGRMFELGDPPDYEPLPESNLVARAGRMGVSPAELAYDIMLSKDGTGLLLYPAHNYLDGSMEPCRELLLERNTVVGLGDGGAHYGFLCDASNTTHLLTYWARDRKRGPLLPLPWVINALTENSALAVGLNDRGVLAPGYKADINVIDFDRLHLHPPHMESDLPAGGSRFHQRADGYVATILAGQVVRRDNVATGALPGRLIRGPQERRTGPD